VLPEPSLQPLPTGMALEPGTRAKSTLEPARGPLVNRQVQVLRLVVGPGALGTCP
jgi:hypothetical protein